MVVTRSWSSRRKNFAGSLEIEWLTLRVRPMFERRVLPLTEAIMLKWRLLVETGRKRGHTYSQPDLLIGTTAAHHGLTVVTRDTREYGVAGIPFVDPWKFAAPARK